MKTYQAPKYENIVPINFNIDTEYMLPIAERLKRNPYVHKDGRVVEEYQFGKYMDKEIAGFIECMPFLDHCKYATSFVYLKENSELDWHTDKGTQCAIIWGLKNWQTSCTYFLPKGHEFGNRHDHIRKYVYKDYIMDTTVEHKVNVQAGEKIIWKISIKDKSFDWLTMNWAKCYNGFKWQQ